MVKRIDTAPAFTAARLALGLDKAALARELRMTSRDARNTIRRLESGKQRIPGPYQIAMEALIERKNNGRP